MGENTDDSFLLMLADKNINKLKKNNLSFNDRLLSLNFCQHVQQKWRIQHFFIFLVCFTNFCHLDPTRSSAPCTN